MRIFPPFLGLMLLSLSVLIAAPSPARAEARDHLSFSAGVLTSIHNPSPGVGILEYRNGFNLLQSSVELHPMAGILGDTAGGFFGYAGLRLEVPISEDWRYENAVGVGGYDKGNGPELYHGLEFCLAASVTRKVGERERIGVQVFHVSNAGLGYPDPGANSFVAMFILGL